MLMNKSLRNPITMNKLAINSIEISTASSGRNLGAIFDSAVSSKAFVNPICKSAWFDLVNISRSRRSLTTDAAKILIQAYVMSKIDYCNSLLYGIPDKLLNRIQRIQNYAARVVLGLHRLSHITPALATLHWLPVNRRIDFKIASLVYKDLNGQAPAYIADLLQPYDPPRKLRSADKHLLSQPPCRLKSYGDTAFCCAAPVVWKNIPHSVKTAKTVDSFKVKLKTHFYSVSFALWYVTAFQSWYTLTDPAHWASLLLLLLLADLVELGLLAAIINIIGLVKLSWWGSIVLPSKSCDLWWLNVDASYVIQYISN